METMTAEAQTEAATTPEAAADAADAPSEVVAVVTPEAFSEMVEEALASGEVDSVQVASDEDVVSFFYLFIYFFDAEKRKKKKKTRKQN